MRWAAYCTVCFYVEEGRARAIHALPPESAHTGWGELSLRRRHHCVPPLPCEALRGSSANRGRGDSDSLRGVTLICAMSCLLYSLQLCGRRPRARDSRPPPTARTRGGGNPTRGRAACGLPIRPFLAVRGEGSAWGVRPGKSLNSKTHGKSLNSKTQFLAFFPGPHRRIRIPGSG